MLILLRHGRTPINAEGRLQGEVDSALDDVGVAQAEAAGVYIRERWHIDEVVSSPLIRAIQTTQSAGFDVGEARLDDRWREIDFGLLDEAPVAEVVIDLHERWRSDVSFVPPEGESMAAMHRRVGEACADLTALARERNVLVVTHATPIKSAAVWAMGGPANSILNMWVNLATVTVLSHVHDQLMLTEFNASTGVDPEI